MQSRDAITRCNQRSAHPKREDVRGQPVRLLRFDLGREIEGGADAGCGERRAFGDLEGGAKVAELAPADRGRWRSVEIGVEIVIEIAWEIAWEIGMEIGGDRSRRRSLH
jgi:hypothetical protein